MDALHALNGQLDFIRSFYLTTESPFKVLLRKHNIPYHETCDGESPDDFDKWAAARKGLEVLGQCSLSLVHKALFGYLRAFVSDKISPADVPKQKGSPFLKYGGLLLERTTFRWEDSPVTRDRIEQINLCRDDFMHYLGIDGSQPIKSKLHFDKHPLSRFDDHLERAIETAMAQAKGEDPPNTPGSLTVDRHGLISAITDVRQFCVFVEAQKPQR
jgi:hypothetical protein